MASIASTEKKERYSDPSSPSLATKRHSPLRQSSARLHSLSPRKRLVNHPLHIRMNLTEMQMDRITDAFAHKLNTSPSKHRSSNGSTQSKVGSFEARRTSKTGSSRGLPNSDFEDPSIVSPTFSELMPAPRVDSLPSSIAERRQKAPPQALHLATQNNHTPMPQKAKMKIVPDGSSPLTPARQDRRGRQEGPSSSRYSAEDMSIHVPEPLRLSQNKFNVPSPNLNAAAFDLSSHWAQLHSSGISPQSSPVNHPAATQPRRSKSNAEGLRRQKSQAMEFHHRRSPVKPPFPPTIAAESPMFSPLAFYFRSQDVPAVRRGGKTMIGDNGWLERTSQPTELCKKTPTKKTGIFDSIKKIAKDMSELHHPQRRYMSTTKPSLSTTFAISLDAREQSLLYCELEYHLTGALNDYIAGELEKGHLVPDNFKKIADMWHQQGRPKVIGFRFDLETQIDLISLHVSEFSFYGRRQANAVEVTGVLHAMKMNARAMRIRTFCQPDSVIAKQLVDSQALFDTIGASRMSQTALAEIVQFFKAIVEREQDHRARSHRESHRSHLTTDPQSILFSPRKESEARSK